MASAARGVKQKDGVPTAGAVTMIMQAHEVEKRAHEPIKGSPMDRAEYLTWVLLLMDILSVVVSVASVEAGWNGVNYARTGLTDGLRGLLCCLSGVSAGVICRRYYILADESDPEYDVDHRPDGLIFVVELLMRLFVIPPGVEAVFRVGGVQHYADRYPVSNLNTAVFLRLYTIVHYSMLQSIYDDDHVVAVARMNMVRNDTAFVCKCLFRGAPSRIILFWMLMILLWGTVNLRCWERTLGMADDADDFEEVLLDFAGHERQDYFHGVGDGVPNWSNAVWCIYVSMTSVGYGDYYPKTHLGRLTVGVCVLAYTVLLSLLIGFFSEAVCMDSGQTKVYEYAHSDKYYKKMQSTAAALLAEFFTAHTMFSALQIRGPPKGLGRITMKSVTGIARLKSVKNRKELAGLLGERQFFYKERLATLATEVTGCTVEAHAKFRRALKAYNDIRERSAPSNIESNLMTVVSMLHDQNDSHSVLAAELKHISEIMELIQGRVDRMEAGFKETGEMEKERKGLAVFKKKEKGNLASDAYIHRMIHRVKLKRVRLRRVRGFFLWRFRLITSFRPRAGRERRQAVPDPVDGAQAQEHDGRPRVGRQVGAGELREAQEVGAPAPPELARLRHPAAVPGQRRRRVRRGGLPRRRRRRRRPRRARGRGQGGRRRRARVRRVTTRGAAPALS